MKLISIDAGTMKLDGGAMFGVVPKVLWEKEYPVDEKNRIEIVMRLLLVDTGERKILIDTGLGDKQDEKFFKMFDAKGINKVYNSLAEHNYTAEDITDVIITHMHFDHVGGAIREEKGKLVPSFPNAKYWISKEQWEWGSNPNPREKASFIKENIAPIQESGQLYLVEEEGEIIPNISVKFFSGHTMGQMIPYINYNGKLVVFGADLMPLKGHLPMAWIMSYDIQPMETLENRKRLYKDLLDNDGILFFEHDPLYEACTIEEAPKGVKVKDFLKVKDI